jgi:pseudouridine-5'-phosphate glycosidase
MPYPQNVDTAREVEELIRSEGALPASIAIIGGQIKIGLDDDDLEQLAHGSQAQKVSARDLPYVIAQKKHGATTVAGTLVCARLAGIPVMATGGLGGVHRHLNEALDISNDLKVLAETNTLVISSGVKSILDIKNTLELLETLGVPVIGYQTADFPAFYTATSGERAPLRLDTVQEVARFMQVKWQLPLKGGILLANPIPEEHAMPAGEINDAIAIALSKAQQQNIHGKEITPFLLSAVKELTKGHSLTSNIALYKNNARLGAAVAVAYAKLH